eukprot:CAMPEP_0184502008 /NCGR_PEP_ID=MMETSP0113_2-20130426/49155_1 /TAXON_ID=91329 /ORGANISM="Norrisiella sphaerica, Strain BC52" /LENGTH=451 /DNA_ID=CAMNT_0026890973 /DNA_START=180 /DNA_END=1535 /DNA_ORIENTATION=+
MRKRKSVMKGNGTTLSRSRPRFSPVCITVCHDGGKQRTFSLETNEPVQKIIKEYCSIERLDFPCFDVLYKGRKIDCTNTSPALGLKAGACVFLAERHFAQVKARGGKEGITCTVPVLEHPNERAGVIGYLHEGDVIQASATWDGWIRIKKWWSYGGWLQYAKNGKRSALFELVPTRGSDKLRLPPLASNPVPAYVTYPCSNNVQLAPEGLTSSALSTVEENQAKICELIMGGSLSRLRSLLEARIDPDCKGSKNISPLSLAACLNLKDEANVLLEARANPNCTSGPLARTPLINSAIYGSGKIAELLMRKRADVSIRDQFNRCALVYAGARGHASVARHILEHKTKRWNAAAASRALRTAIFSNELAVADVVLPHVPRINEKEAVQAYVMKLTASLSWLVPVLQELVWQYWGLDCKQSGTWRKTLPAVANESPRLQAETVLENPTPAPQPT